MRFQLLVALANIFAIAATYSIPGAYERLWFWYAYQADIQANNGVPKTIATGCRLPCDFNHFVQYISRTPIPLPAISTAQYPDIDATAAALDRDGLTGQYNLDKIVQGSGTSIPTLFDSVGKLAKNVLSKVTGPAITGMRVAAMRVQFTRAFASSETVRTNLEAQFPGLKEAFNTKYLVSGGTPYRFLDFVSTANLNPDHKDAILRIVANTQDDSHMANVKAVMLARAYTQGCYKG